MMTIMMTAMMIRHKLGICYIMMIIDDVDVFHDGDDDDNGGECSGGCGFDAADDDDDADNDDDDDDAAQARRWVDEGDA